LNLFKGISQYGRSGNDSNYNFGERWLISEYEDNTKVSEVYGYILRHYKSYGYGPTVREIARAVKLSSPSTVQYHLNTLERYKCISRSKKSSRTIIPLIDAG
jgi:SOS-response transcriptional repressor LexA